MVSSRSSGGSVLLAGSRITSIKFGKSGGFQGMSAKDRIRTGLSFPGARCGVRIGFRHA
jgi:hypothetical protein